jgi:pimeloyl-ACP methyl ester carboxylesterase
MYAISNGTKIYYEVHGEGPAILFAHGAGGNAAIWFEQVAHFAPRYQCITFDHRCFARSPADPATISIPSFRDDALAVLDAVGADRVHLVGQSLGGFTCLRVALDEPGGVRTLTRSCTPGGIPIARPSAAFRELTAATGRGTAGVMSSMARATARDSARMQLYQAINAFNTGFTWDMLGPLSAEEDRVTADRLASLELPVQFVSGVEDPLFATESLAALVPLFRDARIERVTDAGHSPYFEQPAVFNRLLETFLEAHRD